MIKTDLWDVIERERKAKEYIEECAIRRFENRCNMFLVVGGLVLLLLVLINQKGNDMSLMMLKELGIKYWPDNDGGIWFVDPETNTVKSIVD